VSLGIVIVEDVSFSISNNDDSKRHNTAFLDARQEVT